VADNNLFIRGKGSVSWRNKVLVVLIVYFAGFATGIYALAPANTQAAGLTEPNQPKSFPHSFLKSDEFAKSFNSVMQSCIKAGSDAAARIGEFIKEKTTAKKEASKAVARR
jgi:hypothetical protein